MTFLCIALSLVPQLKRGRPAGPWSLYQAKQLNRSSCYFNGCTNFTNLQYFNYQSNGTQLRTNAPMADASRSLARLVADIKYTRIAGMQCMYHEPFVTLKKHILRADCQLKPAPLASFNAAAPIASSVCVMLSSLLAVGTMLMYHSLYS